MYTSWYNSSLGRHLHPLETFTVHVLAGSHPNAALEYARGSQELLAPAYWLVRLFSLELRDKVLVQRKSFSRPVLSSVSFPFLHRQNFSNLVPLNLVNVFLHKHQWTHLIITASSPCCNVCLRVYLLVLMFFQRRIILAINSQNNVILSPEKYFVDF